MDESTLREQIREKKFAPVYMLYGAETYLVRSYARLIRERALGGADDAFNYQLFQSPPGAADFLAAAEAMPLMASRKCVSVSDLNVDTLSAAEWDKLCLFLEDPPAYTTLILWFDAVQADPKKAKWKKLVALADAAGGAVALGKLRPADLARFLEREAVRRGCRMHPSVARGMAERCGGELSALMNELDKVCAYLHYEGPISPDVIEFVTAPTVDATAFQLARAILGGRKPEAFRLLEGLLADRAEPVQVLSALSASFVDAYRVRAARAAGVDDRTLAADLGYKGMEFRLSQAAGPAREYGASRLRACLRELTAADEALKSAPGDRAQMLEETAARLFAHLGR